MTEIERLRADVAAHPRDAGLAYTLGRRLEEAERLEEAAAAYEAALRLDPRHAKARNNLGGVLQMRGELAQALQCFEEARRLDPRLWEPHYNIGNFHKLAGRLDQSVRPYQEAVRLKRGLAAKLPGDDPAFFRTTRSKLLHDIEQIGYLMARGLLPPEFRTATAAYEDALRVMSGAFEGQFLADFPRDLLARVAASYNRLVHFYDAPELAGPAVNPALDTAGIEAAYFVNAPGLTHLDELLTPAGLA